MDMRRKDHQTARQTAMIWDDFGRNLHVTAVRSVLPWVVSAALREAGNLPIQGTARGIVKLGETQVYDELLEMGVVNDICQPVLDVHDELLCCVQERWADEIGSHITNVFENVVKLRVPLKASTAKAQVWGKMPK
jgi:DNA polymerase I-like protein with 3'-5' exonuclease and polymerase domains